MNDKVLEFALSPEEAFGQEDFVAGLYARLGVSPQEFTIRPLQRSIDARGKQVVVRVKVEVLSAGNSPVPLQRVYPNVSTSPEVIVVGAGPAGLFAALRLIELGAKPIVLERGKDVRSRRRDLAAINQDHVVNPESNYCFGEGGAGTYSDGKLYTRSKKRGDISRILETLVSHGANPDILFDTHPHIGTNKLPNIVTALRQSITDAGGEVRFNARVDDIELSGNEVSGVRLQDGTLIKGIAIILATGHSARDIFHLLSRRSVPIEAKSFALGVRIEHDQELIDRIQYHCKTDRGPFLPASSYSVVHQSVVGGRQRGVFSFCMCPGGFIVPSATAPGEVVVNGMSPSRRDSRFANSGIVIAVSEPDFATYAKHGPLAGVYFQSAVEQLACKAAGNTQAAPAQRLVDFVEGRLSSSLPETSYQPGLASTELSEVLPGFIRDSLQQGLRAFGQKMRGYFTNEAVLVGVETRTSSPVRIPRDPETLEHVSIQRLFPCGEGAGYAGGIVSAAMDGERCAEAAAVRYLK